MHFGASELLDMTFDDIDFWLGVAKDVIEMEANDG